MTLFAKELTENQCSLKWYLHYFKGTPSMMIGIDERMALINSITFYKHISWLYWRGYMHTRRDPTCQTLCLMRGSRAGNIGLLQGHPSNKSAKKAGSDFYTIAGRSFITLFKLIRPIGKGGGAYFIKFN